MSLRWFVLFPLAVSLAAAPAEVNLDLRLQNRPDAVKFAVFGDAGTGEKPQYDIGALAAKYHAAFPFTFALYAGDNIYGGDSPRDFVRKFEQPYKTLLDAGVKFYAALGNHDNPNQRFYKLYNMNGERYYSFKPGEKVEVFALDTTYMGPEQVQWLEKALSDSKAEWKIAFFHHPLYSAGFTHGPSTGLRKVLEPLFVKYGVRVVFSGHDHVYERIKPQQGIYYFVEGASGKLRKGNLTSSAETAHGFDQDNTFMLVEIDGDQMHFQTLARSGEVVDSGVIDRQPPQS